MVTLVELDKRIIKGRLRRFFARSFGKKVTLTGERLAGAGCCVVRLRAEGGIAWDELLQSLPAGERAVVARDVSLPVGLSLERVDGEPLRRRILLNGAVWALERAAEQSQVGDVALLDRFGRFSDRVPRLMQACRTLTVVTSNKEEYSALAERLSGMMGAAPMITDQASGVSGCEAVIAPEGLCGFGAIERPRLLFTSDKREGYTVTADCLRSPFDAETLEKYDLFELLTAFRGERLFGDTSEILPHSLAFGQKIVPLQQISGCFGT